MKTSYYDSDELKSFYRVIEAVKAEAAERALDLPLQGMLDRLFAAAERGERNPQMLKAAILADAGARPEAKRAMVGKRRRRPILSLFPAGAAPVVEAHALEAQHEELSYGE